MHLGLGLGLRGLNRFTKPSALTKAWYDRVIAAGGSVTPAQVAAVNALTAAYAAAGLTDANCRFNPFCGNDLTTILYPVFRGGGADTETNTNFVAGDYTPATGLAGDGATKHLGLRLAPTFIAGASWHNCVYSLLDVLNPRMAVAMGAENSTNQRSLLFAHCTISSVDVLRSNLFRSTNGGRVQVSPGTGFLRAVIGNRETATSHALYTDGTLRASSTDSTIGSKPTYSMTMFGRNMVGVVQDFSAGPYGGYSFGTAIPAANIAAISAAWKTYNDAMGRIV